jgi:hypothetical protein
MVFLSEASSSFPLLVSYLEGGLDHTPPSTWISIFFLDKPIHMDVRRKGGITENIL